MTPIDFPESNITFGPPKDMDESQVNSIPVFQGQVVGGNCDGMPVVVCAWQPDPEDLRRLIAGGNIYLMVYGGLPPHSLATEFPIVEGDNKGT